jgi:16S rRNA (guanine1516-N2)-methyltransferase
MQFLANDQEISFEEFQLKFPSEAKILEPFQDKAWCFKIDGPLIKLLHGEFKPVSINVESILENHKINLYHKSLYKEVLARAIGLKKSKPKPKILDATGGLMGDSLLIKSFAVDDIDIIERHPLAAALITNAIANTEIDFNFRFISALEIEQEYDVIFFDPMYEDKNTKSSPKREMLVFRECVGVDEDAVIVAEHLKSLATERLVIKRPIKSKTLIDAPTIQFKGKSTRYDVYIKL